MTGETFNNYQVDRPVHLGTIRGYRAWGVDDLGRLTPATRADYIWSPGINRAVCKCGNYARNVAARHHSCGFYAYFSGSNDYAKTGDIHGIIEAWGTTTVGDRGFRAEYGKILAFVDPVVVYRVKWVHQFAKWCHRRDYEVFFGLGGLLLGLGSLIGGILCMIFGPDWSTQLCGVGLALGIFGLVHAMHSDTCEYESKDYRKIQLVKHNYPDVQWFRNHREMIRAFPVEEPSVPEVTPENYSDFWTTTGTPNQRKDN
jgi:hypothetical protein